MKSRWFPFGAVVVAMAMAMAMASWSVADTEVPGVLRAAETAEAIFRGEQPGTGDVPGRRAPSMTEPIRMASGGVPFEGVGPDNRGGASALWTGGELILWGGWDRGAAYDPGAYLEAGARYDPAVDSWRPTSRGPGVPARRASHAAVWTGSEMIVWGGRSLDGSQPLDTGGRYDPVTDRWRPTPSTAGAANGRYMCSAVWTGSRMIVWGGMGSSAPLRSGASYDPATGAWAPTSLVGAPTPRSAHTAVWTGREMVVWGGSSDSTGGIYDPARDVWRPTAPGPAARAGHTAVWTGAEMVVWGGYVQGGDLDDGSRYEPVTDTWQPTSIGANLPEARGGHTAVWTGSRMLVWGGTAGGGYASGGGAYDPASDSWSAMAVNVPRLEHRAVWTGSEMLVWGGWDAAGARYDPATNAWAPMAGSFPESRESHTAVWTGSKMLVWGGYSNLASTFLDSGASYDVAADAWRPIASGPSARMDHSAVWTGTRMIVWGGLDVSQTLGSGGVYDPASDRWSDVSTGAGCPSPRTDHSAVWTGSEMIVWGGWDGNADQSSGGRYDPATNTWIATSLTGAPAARSEHTAVWTGSEMIVWGGRAFIFDLATGGRYDPARDEWSPVSETGAPSPRCLHTAVWTGAEMIVWGGEPGGAIYRPASDTWRPMSSGTATRTGAESVWTGSHMLVFGDSGGGDRYDVAGDLWTPLPSAGAPRQRYGHTAIWTGGRMIVWGGTNGWPMSSGGAYDPIRDAWSPSLSTAVNALVAKGAGPGAAYDATALGYRVDGTPTPGTIDAFPGQQGGGIDVHVADVDREDRAEVIAAPGPLASLPPRVRAFLMDGTPLPGADFLAYGTGGFGARVAGGAIRRAEILTGPGPSPIFGPHVRAFAYEQATVTPLPRASFFAYGTLRYGVHVAAASVDSDGYDEILTAPGPGAVFGPQVRGFDFDGAVLASISRLSFYAYGTLRYGAEVRGGDLDGDGSAEILTGPGPSSAFAAHLRGFDFGGGVVGSMARVDAIVLPGARLGLQPAAGDLDRDGFHEIVCAAGPDPSFGSRIVALDYDDSALSPLPALSLDPFGLSYGARVAIGPLGYE